MFKQTVLAAGVLMFAGAVVSVLVAWGFAAWGKLAAVHVRIHDGAGFYDVRTVAPDLSTEDLSLCGRLLEGDAAAADIWMGVGVGPGLTDTYVSGKFRLAQPMPVSRWRTAKALWHRCGWPFRALEYRWAQPSNAWAGESSVG